MSGDSGEHLQIRPLTKVKKSGEKYYRREEVEEQLPEAVRLSPSEVSERLKLPNKDTVGYLYDETLVYLLREAHRREDLTMVNHIYSELAVRIDRLLLKQSNQVKIENAEDFKQEVHGRVIKKIFDLDSDKADYAQAMFGDFVTTEAQTEKHKHWRKAEKEKRHAEIDAPNEHGHDLDPSYEGLSPEQEAIILNALGKLPDEVATAAILNFIDGYQIESKDPDEVTVSKIMGVTGRTIRNWFTKAVRTLNSIDGGER
jgi:DNA-directed RNA polymerase specialized sigma24 family protein